MQKYHWLTKLSAKDSNSDQGGDDPHGAGEGIRKKDQSEV